jgi:hypothetical protein
MSAVNNFKKLRELAETTEFSGIFGAAIKSQWFAFIMKHAGTFLFSVSFALILLKIGFDIEQYWHTRNKNLSAKAGLLWSVLQGVALGTAIAGTLFLATVFFVPTSVIFVTTMGLDTVRNVGFFLWNVYQLASLRYAVRNDLTDALTKLKYNYYKNIYINNILKHFIGAAIGAFCTVASAFIFLFPKIGVTFAATTIVTIGAVKVSLAGLAGIAAASAMLAPIVVPIAVAVVSKISNLCKPLFSKVFSFFKSSDNSPKPTPVLELPKPVKQPKLVIKNFSDLALAENHKINFNAYSYHTNTREFIIKLIDANQQNVAFTYLRDAISNKIDLLLEQKSNGLSWIQAHQADKRQQKIDALQLLARFLNDNQVTADDKKISAMDELIKFIENKYPAIDDSFFLEESDTRNILNAAKVYAERFPNRGLLANYLPASPSLRS